MTTTQEAAYSAIIDEILATSDLNTISAKRIRKGLQEKVEYDLSEQKVHRIRGLVGLCNITRTNKAMIASNYDPHHGAVR